MEGLKNGQAGEPLVPKEKEGSKGETPHKPGENEAEEEIAKQRKETSEELEVAKLKREIEDAGQTPEVIEVPEGSFEDQLEVLEEMAKQGHTIGRKKILPPWISSDARKILKEIWEEDTEASVFVIASDDHLKFLEADPAEERRGVVPIEKRIEEVRRKPKVDEKIKPTETDIRAYLQIVINRLKNGEVPPEHSKLAEKTLITDPSHTGGKNAVVVGWNTYKNRLEIDTIAVEYPYDEVRFRLCGEAIK